MLAEEVVTSPANMSVAEAETVKVRLPTLTVFNEDPVSLLRVRSWAPVIERVAVMDEALDFSKTGACKTKGLSYSCAPEVVMLPELSTWNASLVPTVKSAVGVLSPIPTLPAVNRAA